MDFIKPTLISDSHLVSSSIDENDFAEWRACAFNGLGQSSYNWRGMAANAAGDIYVCVFNGVNGDVYKQTAGAGNFTALGLTARLYADICVAPNGDVYACVSNGDIYKQTAGAGAFNALSQTSRSWQGLCAAPNGDIYAAVYGGDIYKQTAGAGDFNALSQTTRAWAGICTNALGDIYAAVYGGDIYKQTAGTGDFIALNQTSRDWWGVAFSPAGHLFATVVSGDIYMLKNQTGNFTALNQISRSYYGVCVAPNGNIYVSTDAPGVGGDIYKQTAWAGSFFALNQTSRLWEAVAAAPNGDVYAAAIGPPLGTGDIYKRTAGAGDFIALSQTLRAWSAMCAAPNGDVYAAVSNGDIYKQTAGTGDFIALSQTARGWSAMCAAPNGDIYAAVSNGDVYKQTAGEGDFVALGQIYRNWQGLSANADGDIYAAVYGGDIYKQTAGTGSFAPLSQTSRDWTSICASVDGNVYATVNSGDIYKQTAGAGNFTALNQLALAWYGICAAPNGDIYATANNGDIYKMEHNTGPFYSIGDMIIITGYGVHKIYQALLSGTNNYPPTSPTQWLEYSATNRWKAFDKIVGSQSEKLLSMNHVLAPGAIDSVALLNLESTSVQIKMTDPAHLGADAMSGAVARANMKISGLDGLAFIDFNVAGILSEGVSENAKIEITDSAGKKIIGFIKALGTAETYDANLLASLNLTSGWTPSNVTVSDANTFVTTAPNGYIYKTALAEVGALYKSAMDSAQTSGTTKFTGAAFNPEYALDGSTADYRTADDTTLIFVNSASGATVDINSVSITKVLTPSATGVRITSTQGGTTYNWASKEAGFNYDDPAGYTYKISIVYNETITTGTSKTDVVKLDLPITYSTAKLSITVNHSTSLAKLGELIVGVKTNIGTMKYSPSVGITDYSTKEVDTFGHYSIVPRTFAKRMTCSLFIPNTIIDEVIRLLTLYRSTELVWVGDESFNSLIVYGFYKDFQVVFSRPLSSDCALEIEGLT